MSINSSSFLSTKCLLSAFKGEKYIVFKEFSYNVMKSVEITFRPDFISHSRQYVVFSCKIYIYSVVCLMSFSSLKYHSLIVNFEIKRKVTIKIILKTIRPLGRMCSTKKASTFVAWETEKPEKNAIYLSSAKTFAAISLWYDTEKKCIIAIFAFWLWLNVPDNAIYFTKKYTRPCCILHHNLPLHNSTLFR